MGQVHAPTSPAQSHVCKTAHCRRGQGDGSMPPPKQLVAIKGVVLGAGGEQWESI